ncbi:MAG: hypothetical protein HQL52_03525 [Magnetococcales bacterium]|nr:hypothetical protein [Magnetococcales bacterium]
MDYLNDHWTTEIEQLGYVPFAVKAQDLILNARTPFAFTIGGAWGSGKTSMLRTLMRSLGGKPLAVRSGSSPEEEKETLEEQSLPDVLQAWTKLRPNPDERVRAVWFNPWHYQNEPNPVIPLLHEIREQIRFQLLKKDLTSATHVAMDTALNSLGSLLDAAVHLVSGKKVSVGKEITINLEKAHGKQQRESFSEPVDAQRFFLQFEKAVRQVVNPENDDDKARLVIFIDDLDRCHDQVVFSLLEAIKLYLSSRHCVFVFGLDRTHVESAVAKAGEYGQAEAAQYVEKLFQVRLHLPAPEKDELWWFVYCLMRQLEMDMGEAAIDFLMPLLPANPRVIKTALNGLKHYQFLVSSDETDPENKQADTEKLILVHLLRFYFPDAYELLLQDPDAGLVSLLEVFKDRKGSQNEAQRYLHRVVENPLVEAPRTTAGSSGGGELDKKKEEPPMDDDRFRQLRAGAGRAGAIKLFKKKFEEQFKLAAELEPYLI